MTLPLHDSSAAGWLLPVTGTIETSIGKVLLGNAAYTSDDYRISGGQRLPYRAFPYRYDDTRRGGKATQGIFVEYDDALHYLVQRSERGMKILQEG